MTTCKWMCLSAMTTPSLTTLTLPLNKKTATPRTIPPARNSPLPLFTTSQSASLAATPKQTKYSRGMMKRRKSQLSLRSSDLLSLTFMISRYKGNSKIRERRRTRVRRNRLQGSLSTIKALATRLRHSRGTCLPSPTS